jgi:hypothetical protein
MDSRMLNSADELLVVHGVGMMNQVQIVTWGYVGRTMEAVSPICRYHRNPAILP